MAAKIHIIMQHIITVNKSRAAVVSINTHFYSEFLLSIKISIYFEYVMIIILNNTLSSTVVLQYVLWAKKRKMCKVTDGPVYIYYHRFFALCLTVSQLVIVWPVYVSC